MAGSIPRGFGFPPPIRLYLTPSPDLEEEAIEEESAKRTASRVFEETIEKKQRSEAEPVSFKAEEKSPDIAKGPLEAAAVLTQALTSKTPLQPLRSLVQVCHEITLNHLCLAMNHCSKDVFFFLLMARARQEVSKAIQQASKTLNHSEVSSLPVVIERESPDPAAIQNWCHLSNQLKQKLDQFKRGSLTEAKRDEEAKQVRETSILLLTKVFAFSSKNHLDLQNLVRKCPLAFFNKLMVPVIQEFQSHYCLCLIFQLRTSKSDNVQPRTQEQDLKGAIQIRHARREHVLFALSAGLPPDLFKLLCQWLRREDRLDLIDEACKLPCSLEQLIILFWLGDPSVVVGELRLLKPDAPLLEDEQIVRHLKIAIEHKAPPEVIQFLLQRMQNQESEQSIVRTSSAEKLLRVANSSARWREIFELGLQHDLSLEILQSLAAILQANNLGKDYLIRLFSRALAESACMSRIVKLIHLAHPDTEVLSSALMDVLKAMDGKKTAWSWDDLSKFVHRLVYVDHFKPTHQQIEYFLHQQSHLDKSIFQANVGFILDTLNSLLHSTNSQERKRLWTEFSDNRHLPLEIVNKLSNY